MDAELRKKVCRLVAGIVVADDDLDEKEDAFIDRLMLKFGIPADERGELFPIVDSAEAASEIKTLPKDVQDEAFSLLVEAAAADGKIVAEERAYIGAVADALGLDAAVVDERLKNAVG
ncbi:MAG: hypothetical protein HYV09_36880 [Deltaproteobacteria bacterium]|nr:hypothetical protein [Deltaproteobacteria bacterium]